MKRFLTIILRCGVLAAGIAALAICGGLTWWIISGWASNPNHHVIMTVLLAGLYLGVIPFFIALYQAMKLLGYIDTNRAFSEISIKALKVITRCTGAIFITCSLVGLPFFYYWAELDDAPGLVLIGLAISGIAFIVTVCASLLKILLQEALDANKVQE